jgi:hypothetical protein
LHQELQTTQLCDAGTELARLTRPFPAHQRLDLAGHRTTADQGITRDQAWDGYCSWAMTAAAGTGRWW